MGWIFSKWMPRNFWTVFEVIVENNLGIAVNDLSEIKDRLLEISDMQYNTMAQNVKKISNKLRNGYYIKAALESIDR